MFFQEFMRIPNKGMEPLKYAALSMTPEFPAVSKRVQYQMCAGEYGREGAVFRCGNEI